jgi:hypothetical protein
MAPNLEDLLKTVLERRATRVQVLNKVTALAADGRWKHGFVVTVNVESEGRTEKFEFPLGEVVADHELSEQKREHTPEYESFQRTLTSLFHRVNIIERRLTLIKQTKLPDLAIEVQG